MALGWLARALGKWQGPVSTPPAPASRTAAPQAELRFIDGLIDATNLVEARSRLETLSHSHAADAEVLARLGRVHYQQGDPAGAEKILRAAVSADPNHALALSFLAASRMQLGDARGAIAAGDAAARLNARDAQLQNLLGGAHVSLGQFEAAAEHFHRALELDPEDPTPLLNLQALEQRLADSRRFVAKRPITESIRHKTLNRLMDEFRRRSLDVFGLEVLLSLTAANRAGFDTALEVANAYSNAQGLSLNAVMWMASVLEQSGAYERAIPLRELAYRMNPSLPETQLNLGNMLASEGGAHWTEGWRLKEEAARKINPPAYVSEVPEWDGRDLGQLRLFVYQEQGFGDAVLALRFIPLLAARGIRVVLWVKTALADVARSVSGYEEFLASETRPDPRQHGCSYAAPLAGLVRPLKLGPAAIRRPPVLRAPEEMAEAWRQRLSALPPGKRIGLAAIGNENRADDWLRTVPPEVLAPLAELPGVSWVNLSVDRRKETDALIGLFKMHDPTPQIRNYGDTAALASALDAVVAIDCSAAHVAACIGKPVWVLAPTFRDWRWQVADDLQPWWPTVTLLRAEGPGIWTRAIAQLKQDLERFLRTSA
jgi:tetratricopeptide (TPR) repeat protein